MANGYERIEGVEVGQYVGYRFFRVDPAWRRLPIDERGAGKEAFADVIEEFARRMEGLRVYSTTGVRPEADFFLWSITQRYDDLLELGAALNGTPLAAWLTTPYSYSARRSRRSTRTRSACARVAWRRETRRTSSYLREAPPLVLPHLRGARLQGGSTPRSAAGSSRSRTTRRTPSGSTTRSSSPPSRPRSPQTSCI